MLETPTKTPSTPARRGRPKKQPNATQNTRETLLNAGMAVLTQSGFSRSGIDGILKLIGVPKGSFYHYFASKEAFGLAVLAKYRRYFEAKLDKFLRDPAYPPLQRLQRFCDDAKAGMARYDFQRGCLVGNLEQESSHLSEAFRVQLQETYLSWQNRVAACLQEGIERQEIALTLSLEDTAHAFWMGWEGAVHRARLMKSAQPLDTFFAFFICAIEPKHA